MNNISRTSSYTAPRPPERPIAPKQDQAPQTAPQPPQNTGAPRADTGSKINYLA